MLSRELHQVHPQDVSRPKKGAGVIGFDIIEWAADWRDKDAQCAAFELLIKTVFYFASCGNCIIIAIYRQIRTLHIILSMCVM